MRRIFYLLAALVSLLSYSEGTADDGQPVNEYQAKAAYIYNFVKFVEWPGAQALSQTHQVNICIAGENPFDPAIFKKVSTPQLAFNVISDVAENALASCHLLFITRSEDSRVNSLLSTTRSLPVLTVSEVGNFVEDGGIIEMLRSEKNIGLFSKDKINLRINLKAATAKGLRIDAQLLGIAAEVIK